MLARSPYESGHLRPVGATGGRPRLGEPDRPGSTVFRRDGTLRRPQRLPRSPPVCKIRPGSGGFVAFLRAGSGFGMRLTRGLRPAVRGGGRGGRRWRPRRPGGARGCRGPSRCADAGVEDGRAVGQEGVGRALHAAAPALLASPRPRRGGGRRRRRRPGSWPGPGRSRRPGRPGLAGSTGRAGRGRRPGGRPRRSGPPPWPRPALRPPSAPPWPAAGSMARSRAAAARSGPARAGPAPGSPGSGSPRTCRAR